MQAEGIRTGDRYDERNDRGRIVGGWTATGDAVIDDGFAYIPVKYHDGHEDAIVQPVGTQIDISFGYGTPEPEHYVIHNGQRYDVPKTER